MFLQLLDLGHPADPFMECEYQCHDSVLDSRTAT